MSIFLTRRTLSVALLIVGCISGSAFVNLLERQQRDRLNPLLKYIDSGVPANRVSELFLQHSSVTDDDLRFLGRLPEVRNLRLSDTNVQGPGLRYLNVLSHLQSLDLDNLGLGDSGFGNITYSAELRQLTVNNELTARGKLTDGSAIVFLNLPSLEVLDLSYNYVGVETCNAVGRCPLRVVYLRNCSLIDDAAVSEIVRASTIEVLGLEGTAVGDKGVEELSMLGNLRELNLCRTRISESAVEVLSRMSSLERLDVRETQLTQSDIGSIRAALPYCEVLSD